MSEESVKRDWGRLDPRRMNVDVAGRGVSFGRVAAEPIVPSACLANPGLCSRLTTIAAQGWSGVARLAPKREAVDGQLSACSVRWLRSVRVARRWGSRLVLKLGNYPSVNAFVCLLDLIEAILTFKEVLLFRVGHKGSNPLSGSQRNLSIGGCNSQLLALGYDM